MTPKKSLSKTIAQARANVALQVGRYSICHMPKGTPGGAFWIECTAGEREGEGMQTSAAKLEAAISEFYKANF